MGVRPMIVALPGAAALLMGAAMAAPTPPWPVLAPDGLVLPGGRGVRFGMAMAATSTLATGALGRPVGQGTYPDCGQGTAIRHVDYRGGLELSFIGGRFSGWTVGESGDARLRTMRAIHVGSSLAQVRRAYPDVATDDSGETVAFASDRGPSGFLDGKGPGARVTELHAGATCIVN